MCIKSIEREQKKEEVRVKKKRKDCEMRLGKNSPGKKIVYLP
jgi:hypothetical protein